VSGGRHDTRRDRCRSDCRSVCRQRPRANGQLGEAVQPGGVAERHQVEPAAAALAAGDGAVLGARVADPLAPLRVSLAGEPARAHTRETRLGRRGDGAETDASYRRRVPVQEATLRAARDDADEEPIPLLDPAPRHVGSAPVGADGASELAPALDLFDDLLQVALAEAERRFGAGAAADPYRGLYLLPDEVEQSLTWARGQPMFPPASSGGAIALGTASPRLVKLTIVAAQARFVNDALSNLFQEIVLGGILSIVVFAAKTAFILWVFVWVRWTLPRFRYDQLMRIGWKVLLPLALANLLWVAGLVTLKVL